MKQLGILLAAAIALLLAGCAASPQLPASPPADAGQQAAPAVPPATGGEQPQAPQNVPPAPGNNATPPSPPSSSPPLPEPEPAAAQQGKPDLQLMAIAFDNPVSLYQVIAGSVTNYNSGTAASPATKTAYYVDSVLAGTVDVPPMQPGASSTVGFRFVCQKAGGHTLSAMVNYEGLVDEQNELNNGRAIVFTCNE